MNSNVMALAECRRLMESKRELNILDVRTPAEYARVHATGARLMPLDQLDPVAVAAQRGGGDEALYIICHSGARASKACQRLQEAGLAGVYFIEGGTVGWEKMGLPVERGGGKVISLERQVRIAAGSLVVLGALLAWRVHPAFVALSALVGAGLVFAGISDYCGMAIVLGKMPWNRTRN